LCQQAAYQFGDALLFGGELLPLLLKLILFHLSAFGVSGELFGPLSHVRLQVPQQAQLCAEQLRNLRLIILCGLIRGLRRRALRRRLRRLGCLGADVNDDD